MELHFILIFKSCIQSIEARTNTVWIQINANVARYKLMHSM